MANPLTRLIKSSYLGNNRLKQLGFQIDYTPEQVQELLKCQNDAIYFIENYCKIVSLDRLSSMSVRKKK